MSEAQVNCILFCLDVFSELCKNREVSLLKKRDSQFIQSSEALFHISNLTPFAANILKGLPHNLIITVSKDLKQDGSETDCVIMIDILS